MNKKIIHIDNQSLFDDYVKTLLLEQRYLSMLEFNKDKQLLEKSRLLNLFFTWKYFNEKKDKIVQDLLREYEIKTTRADISIDYTNNEIIIYFK